MDKLIYTFRTCPFKDEIPNVFIFGELKKDPTLFFDRIMKEKPGKILGIAKSNDFSHFENIAINQFNKEKRIASDGEGYFTLYVPKNKCFSSSTKPTTSFCNWTAYRIMEFLKRNNLDIKFSFLHIKQEDFADLKLKSDSLVFDS